MNEPKNFVIAHAPGKINCYFRVGPPREDGYHDVASLYVAVSLFEEIRATLRQDGELHLRLDEASTVVDEPETFPLGPGNLVHQAAQLLREHAGVNLGADLEILKRVPIAGGMGGGSADAAATLVACNELWGTGLDREELGRLGARLGADVPFALMGGAAIGLGVGDQLAPLLTRARTDWVLIPASYGLSTPRVYAMLDRLRAGQSIPVPTEVDPQVIKALMEPDAQALADTLVNDLTQASLALAPELGTVRDLAEGAGALRAMVSGSGPTLALLVRDAEHAREVMAQLGDEVGVATLAVQAPAPGARIVHSQ
ncbi:4-(cytidine 5'-diphospho)-2-C-methyl-D-erythritol kinase [Glutamicibacter creatinolyticus]|uniref:4-diphosphocytidyl-2-C-methyl-D-erythritol kinase n=2 Tax=Glutamicibacter creatinolyticus TaxID=162496 RepID=A0A5B7WQI3_9MICC|nr:MULTISPECIES: 4-(cytidine 5'-diphospho)-2-C-methyl-D-erythritol kinase [Glutamicibacter]QCY46396.1 4-diphosphocytidyl-2-C-methyl-D-erythritol kinase [Glutamicibacter creatinolyticus]TLK53608.1 4-(cytidine 5'-diphospho)-2-C-methyl-D-erythritol kinase [Glutamicibacter sp. V16R2B1]